MKEKYTIEKKWGETPLEALERLRADEHIPADIPMTYAGRLDPAAEGLLVILTGEECKKKEAYTALSKTYQPEIIFGISTDSYDLLGIPAYSGTAKKSSAELFLAVESYFKSHCGKQMQAYPPYSSKHIDTGILPPPHEVELYEYMGLHISERSREEIISRAEKLTEIVVGDFRQEEIKKAWQNLPAFAKLPTLSLELTVGSGFYIRQLAEDLGKTLGTGACLYSLVRTKVGK